MIKKPHQSSEIQPLRSSDWDIIDTISDSEDEVEYDSGVILDDFDRIAARLRHVMVRVGGTATSALTQTRLLTELLQLIIPGGNYNVLYQYDRIAALISFAIQCIQAGAGEERRMKVALAILYRVSLDPNSVPFMRDESLTQTLLTLVEKVADAKRGETKTERSRRRPSPEITPGRISQDCSRDDVDALLCGVFMETTADEFYRKDLCWAQNAGSISLVILRRIKDEETRLTPIEVATYLRLAQQEGLAFHRAENQTAENVLRLFLLLELIDDMETLQSLAFDSCIFVAILRASSRRKMAFVSELIEKTLRILAILSLEDSTWSKWETLVKAFLTILFDLPGSSFLWGQADKTHIQDDEQAIRLLTLGVLGSLGEENVSCARELANCTVEHKVPQKKNRNDGRILEVLSDCFLLLEAKDPSETKNFTIKDHYTSVTKCTLAVVLAHICGDLDGYNRLLRRGCTAASFLEALRLFLIVLQKADLLQDDAVLRIDSAMQRWTAYDKGVAPTEECGQASPDNARKPKTASCATCVRFSPKARVASKGLSTCSGEAEALNAMLVSPKQLRKSVAARGDSSCVKTVDSPRAPARTPLLRRRATGQPDAMPATGNLQRASPFSFSKLCASANKRSCSSKAPSPIAKAPKMKASVSPQKTKSAGSPKVSPKAKSGPRNTPCSKTPIRELSGPTHHASASSASSPTDTGRSDEEQTGVSDELRAVPRKDLFSRLAAPPDDDVAICIDDDLTICATTLPPASRFKSWHYHLVKSGVLPSFAPPPPKRRNRNRPPPPPRLSALPTSNPICTPPIRGLLQTARQSAIPQSIRRKRPGSPSPEQPTLLKRARGGDAPVRVRADDPPRVGNGAPK